MQIAKEKKTGKQTQKEKKSFFQVDVIWLGPSCTEHVVISWHKLPKVLFSIL